MNSFLTKEEDLFLLEHLGLPDIAQSEWSLRLGGLVEKPLRLAYADLLRFRQQTVVSVHKCAGNPLKFPLEPSPDRSGNVEWTGVSLREILEEVGHDSCAKFMIACGADGGVFDGISVPAYEKDVPMEKALAGEVMLATHMNGELLTAARGGPVRLVVPGHYGTNSVKWLRRIELAERRSQSLFTTTYYNDRIPGSNALKPVWDLAPEAIIVSPAEQSVLVSGDIAVWGWAWGAHEIARVDVSPDAGESWIQATISRREQFEWQRFDAVVRQERGALRLLPRAVDVTGVVQPLLEGRNRAVEVRTLV